MEGKTQLTMGIHLRFIFKSLFDIFVLVHVSIGTNIGISIVFVSPD